MPRRVVTECLNCGDIKTVNNGQGKYCSLVCQEQHRWTTETIPKIESGKCSTVRTLKRYLFEKRGEQCEECGQSNLWKGKPLTLQVDHVDGNSDNNDIGNLRILCPNCHTQTSTFGPKGNGNRYKKNTKRNSYLREYKNSAR